MMLFDVVQVKVDVDVQVVGEVNVIEHGVVKNDVVVREKFFRVFFREMFL